MALHARWTATKDAEQTVSTTSDGPVHPKKMTDPSVEESVEDSNRRENGRSICANLFLILNVCDPNKTNEWVSRLASMTAEIAAGLHCLYCRLEEYVLLQVHRAGFLLAYAKEGIVEAIDLIKKVAKKTPPLFTLCANNLRKLRAEARSNVNPSQ